MANPFYTYSGAFIPGTLARAEQVATEYLAVQAGFAGLAWQGVDSGAANAYVVTTNGAPTGSYTDGQIVEFKAVNANTGASTVNVNGIGVVSLTGFNGQSLTGGAIAATTWVTCRYNSTFSAFTLIAPTSQVITSNTISASAPTHLVGLTAAGGVSTACAPIDVTFALDQSIVPTWTGAHTFSGAVTFNSTVSFSGGLSLTGASGQYAATLTGSSSAGNSRGLEVNAGVNNSDIAFLVNNQSGVTQFFEINGVGSVTVGNPTGGAKGVGTINAQNLYVQGAAVLTSAATSANPSAIIGLAAVNGTAATFMTSDSAPPLSQAIAPTWTAAHVFTPSSAVTAVTINAKANNAALFIQGGTNTVNQYLLEIQSGSGVGFSSGLLVTAGTSNLDANVSFQNAAGAVLFAQILGDGEFMFTPPTAAGAQTTNFYQVGMMDIPMQAGANTPVFQSRGKWIEATGNVTVPANSSVAFPIGTCFQVYNAHGSNITLAVTTDTLTWLPTLNTGSRTLAAGGLATFYKNTATSWRVYGFGLS